MSLLSRSSPFPSPNDTIINTVSPKMSSTHTKLLTKPSNHSPTHKDVHAHTIPLASPSDPFLAQYIKTPNLSSCLNNHQLYFRSINRQRKIKSLEIYRKYLVNTEPQPVRVKSAVASPSRVTLKSPGIRPKNFNQHHEQPDEHKRSPFSKRKELGSPKAGPKVHDAVVDSKDDLPITKKYLPEEFMDCGIDDLINLITRMMSSLISLNDKSVPSSISKPTSSSSSSNSLLTRYHSRTPPSISTHTYLTRLTKFNNFNPATLLTTIYYIDLLSHQYQPFFTLNSWTVHRFLLVGTMLAQKSMEDFFYTNDHYAKVGGVAISELNCLELDFLERVDWRCMPGKQLKAKGESSIKYAKDVLALYYHQLIELMGKNTTVIRTSQDQALTHYLPGSAALQPHFTFAATLKSNPGDTQDMAEDRSMSMSGDDVSIDDSDYDSNEDATSDNYEDESIKNEKVEDEGNISVLQRYNSKGYSVDGSSSPHLKRKRYSQFE